MRTDLTGKTVAITGASGGIGAALVDAFAAERAGLALLAHSHVERLERQVAARTGSAPVRCAGVDVRDAGAVARAFEQLAQELGRLDVCVVNAEVWPEPSTPLHRMEPERIREVTEINLQGGLFTARAFLRQLARLGPRADGHGASLLLIGSTDFGRRARSTSSGCALASTPPRPIGSRACGRVPDLTQSSRGARRPPEPRPVGGT